VQVTDERALAALTAQPNPEPVKGMLARAVCALTGKRAPEEAWATLIHPQDVVGVKPNGLGGRLNATSRELIEAVIAALRSVGVRPANIVVWDQYEPYLRNLRLTPRAAPDDVRYLYYAVRGVGGDYGPPIRHGAGESRFCKPVHQVTAIVNLPVFKDHGMAGVTVSLKNLTHGTVDNPRDFHHRLSDEIAQVYATPILAPKVRLVIGDALRVQYEGGPRDSPFKALHHSLYASTDPVALDATALGLIEALRRKKGMSSLVASARAPAYIEAGQSLGLGVADPARIRLERIRLG
jgi:uncharacterized protein (DUF362 family)